MKKQTLPLTNNVLDLQKYKKERLTREKPTLPDPHEIIEEIQVMLCETCGEKKFLLSAQSTSIYCSSCLTPVYILKWDDK